MFAANNNQQLSEPNVLYIENKLPKIVKKRDSTKRKMMAKKKEIRKKVGLKQKKKNELNLQKQAEVENNMKRELEEQMENKDPNDPLYTPSQIEVKQETCEEKNGNHKGADNIAAKTSEDCKENEKNRYEYGKRKKSDPNYEFMNEEDFATEIELDNDNDEDDPLIFLKDISAQDKRKKRKLSRMRDCLETCKYKCTTKFPRNQRIDVFEYFWQLNKEEKINFIRKHIRKPILTRIRNKKRGGNNNCRYFMKYYQVEAGAIHKPIESADKKQANGEASDEDLIKVCCKFFEGTLGITSYKIKEALAGYELQKEEIKQPLGDHRQEEQNKLSEKAGKPSKPKQYLDPETGNLTDTKPKKKHKRRKPGEPEAERFPRPINCAIRCIFKCHQNFSEEERKRICDTFWSLDFKRRKDFILARIETKDVETITNPEFRKTKRPTRAFRTRYFLRSGINSENKRVCKHFMMSTLCISRKYFENAIKYADKATGSYIGMDGRGTVHKITPERKQAIKDHISSYPVWLPSKKSKLRCLHHSLSIKRMYKEYRKKCLEDQTKPVSEFYYYQTFRDDFRLMFLSNKGANKNRGFLNNIPNISHFTGDEPGGCWLDSEGNLLDVKSFCLAKNLKSKKDSTLQQEFQQAPASLVGTSQLNEPLNFITAPVVQQLAVSFIDSSISSTASDF